jgi:hypothetical protein
MVIQDNKIKSKPHLQGIGRKIQLWTSTTEILEGQFEDNELNGIGRKISIAFSGDLLYQIGYWDKGKLNGFGQ